MVAKSAAVWTFGDADARAPRVAGRAAGRAAVRWTTSSRSATARRSTKTRTCLNELDALRALQGGDASRLCLFGPTALPHHDSSRRLARRVIGASENARGDDCVAGGREISASIPGRWTTPVTATRARLMR
jgi:hypothetical protein